MSWNSSSYGDTTEGLPFWPGVPCFECGKFCGRDDHFEIEHFEMSSTIASVEAWHKVCPRDRATTQA